jgi:hypothetical protein
LSEELARLEAAVEQAGVSISASVLFESTEDHGTIREPRGDTEQFYVDAKAPCTVVSS